MDVVTAAQQRDRRILLPGPHFVYPFIHPRTLESFSLFAY